MAGSVQNRVLVRGDFDPLRLNFDPAIIRIALAKQPKLLHRFQPNFVQEQVFIVVVHRGRKLISTIMWQE